MSPEIIVAVISVAGIIVSGTLTALVALYTHNKAQESYTRTQALALEFDQLQEENARLRTRITESEAEFERKLKAQAAEFTKKLADQQDEINILRQENRELKKKLKGGNW